MGGGKLAASYLAADLIDKIAWFNAPMLIGGDGLPATNGFGIDNLEQAPTFIRMGTVEIGDDFLAAFKRNYGLQ